MVAGPYAPRFGEAKNSWLTGTAAWSFYTASQGILGVKPDYDGLKIDPCLPKELGELTVTRKFRGSEYEVHILNQAGDEKGEIQLTVQASRGSRDPVNGSGETAARYSGAQNDIKGDCPAKENAAIPFICILHFMQNCDILMP